MQQFAALGRRKAQLTAGAPAREQLVPGLSWSFPRDLSLDLAETMDDSGGK